MATTKEGGVYVKRQGKLFVVVDAEGNPVPGRYYNPKTGNVTKTPPKPPKSEETEDPETPADSQE